MEPLKLLFTKGKLRCDSYKESKNLHNYNSIQKFIDLV
jgi:hypothetical protein